MVASARFLVILELEPLLGRLAGLRLRLRLRVRLRDLARWRRSSGDRDRDRCVRCWCLCAPVCVGVDSASASGCVGCVGMAAGGRVDPGADADADGAEESGKKEDIGGRRKQKQKEN